MLPDEFERTSLYWSGIILISTSIPVSGVKYSSIIFCIICTYWFERFTHTCIWSLFVFFVEYACSVNEATNLCIFIHADLNIPGFPGSSAPSWYIHKRSIARSFVIRLSTAVARKCVTELWLVVSSAIRYGISSGLSARLLSCSAAISSDDITATPLSLSLHCIALFSNSTSLS